MTNYAHAGNLKSRIDLYRYREPRFDPVDTAVELLPKEGLGLVLDVGAGIGRYTRRLRAEHPRAAVVAIDKSPGMLAEVEAPVMVADAQAIPYPDDSADAVLAMHMLYHVADVAEALAEFRRVLKPGGTFLASTNIAGDMAEIGAVWERAARSTTGPGAYDFNTALDGFNSASAPAPLRAAFDTVEEFREEGVVKVPEPGPLLGYLASLRSWADCEDAAFDALLEAAARELAGHFAEHRTFDFTKTAVFYRCH
nr:class I SAM-dependent methyltransferase [Glycomyces amatae]